MRAHWLLTTLTVLAPVGVADANPPRGYAERPCGFDLDDDGVIGEAEDDCRVCDGVTSDPDGDGVDEDLIYVDCDAGTDSGSCGTPDAPCGSVTYAMETRMDGPDDGAEDIVCFSGTCSPNAVRPQYGGLANTRIVPASGSQARDFELATDPAMLVGWDRDGDGEYPPYDTDDEAVLDGTGLARAITVRNSTASHLELAHFEAREYGRVGNGGGFFAQGPSHNYLHDIELENINREMPTPSGRIVFDFFTSQDNHYFWAKNIDCRDCGGYFVRGAGGNGPTEAGPFRFEGISLTMHPCSFGSSAACDAQPYANVAKLWGYMRGVEFLDSVFDGDPTNRTLGNHPSHWPTGVGVVNCAEDFVVRNNTFIDTQGLYVQGYAAGFCDGPEVRPTSDVLFENNYVVFEELDRAIAATALQPVGKVAGANVGDVAIIDNIFRSTPAGGMRACMTYSAGNEIDQPDHLITFEDNRCEGSQGEAIRLIQPVNANAHQSYSIVGNVFTGNAGKFISAGYGPSAYAADSNIYGGMADFRWAASDNIDFAAFQAAAGTDANSQHCADESCVPVVACGDGTCDPDEDCGSCPKDCGEVDGGGEGGPGDDDDGDAGDEAGEGDDTGGGTVGDGGESGRDTPSGPTDGSGSGPETDGGTGGPGFDGDASGCSCRTEPGGGPGALAILGVLGLLRTRRRSDRSRGVAHAPPPWLTAGCTDTSTADAACRRR